jgi:hypothetical protein
MPAAINYYSARLARFSRSKRDLFTLFSRCRAGMFFKKFGAAVRGETANFA